MLGHKLKGGVTVVREYADLPQIDAYAGELNQVWTNLIDNAVDAMDGAGTLTVRTRAEGDGVVVEIADTGSGMPPEVVARAFEPFFTTKDVGKGTGLGLDIARRIVVERHGGRSTSTPPARGQGHRDAGEPALPGRADRAPIGAQRHRNAPLVSARRSSAEAVRPRRRQPDHDAVLGHHRAAVVVPVGVLAADRPVVLDQLVDGLVVRIRATPENVASASIDGVGPEALAVDLQCGPGLASEVEVLRAVGRRADPDQAVVLQGVEHVRQLRLAVAAQRRQHGLVGGAGCRERLLEFHAGTRWVGSR